MAVDFPYLTSAGFCPSQVQWGAAPRTIAVESVVNGGVQRQGTPWKKWMLTTVLPATAQPAVRGGVEAFFDALNGQEVAVNHWHYGRVGLTGTGTPMGTCNPSGVQVNANAAQFALTVVLKGCGNARTLEPGDMVKIGNQLIMVPSLLTATGGGLITLPVTGGLRAAAAANAAVTLIKPTAQFILREPDWRASYTGRRVSSEFAVDWMEVFP